jgi:hypothetical protein
MGAKQMKNDALKSEFEELRTKLISANDPVQSETELEPVYAELLEFLVKNERYRKELVVLLGEVIKSFRNPHAINGRFFPGMAIAYCMHVLRWPEIYNLAVSENHDFYSKKMQRGMADILNSYDDSWEDKDFYQRFR